MSTTSTTFTMSTSRSFVLDYSTKCGIFSLFYIYILFKESVMGFNKKHSKVVVKKRKKSDLSSTKWEFVSQPKKVVYFYHDGKKMENFKIWHLLQVS